MSSKTTILSKKENLLLENLLEKFGVIVTFSQILKEFSYNKGARQQVRNLVAKLSKNGWLVRIKNGIYFISNLESRGFVGLSSITIASIINRNSYVSLEEALRYHGIFDQQVNIVSSVCLKREKQRDIQGIKYKFIKTSKDNFYGFSEYQLDGYVVKIASLEKAIFDLINFSRSVYTLDLILEKFRDYKDYFDFDKLQDVAKKQSITSKKIVGFLLDLAGLNSEFIYQDIKNKKGSSLMTSDSTLFNAKWNLYYHSYFKV